MERCLVIGAGDIALTEIERQEGDLVIAVDGGYQYCGLLHLEPDYIIGDFDSVEESRRAEIERLLEAEPDKVTVLPCEKDDTDMLAALRLGLLKGCKEFFLYAGMGGRLEHTLANIQCLTFLRRNEARGYLMDADCMVTVIENETVHFRPQEGLVSVFVLGERAEDVSIEGLKYPLDHVVLTNDFPVGVSNEFMGQESSITVGKGVLVIIVRWC